jgi:hypothetical protein
VNEIQNGRTFALKSLILCLVIKKLRLSLLHFVVTINSVLHVSGDGSSYQTLKTVAAEGGVSNCRTNLPTNQPHAAESYLRS